MEKKEESLIYGHGKFFSSHWVYRRVRKEQISPKNHYVIIPRILAGVTKNKIFSMAAHILYLLYLEITELLNLWMSNS